MQNKDLNTDVLVIGAGGAGFAAALSAHQNGAEVILAEKENQVGGSTGMSGGGISATNTRFQREAGIKDSKASWMKLQHEREDTPDHSNKYPDYNLVSSFMDEAPKTTEWLVDFCNHKYEEITGFGVDKVRRIHCALKNGGLGGPVVISNLAKTVKKKDITVLTNMDAEELVVRDEAVKGAIFDGKDGKITIYAQAVILATGGFAKNSKLLEKYVPQMKAAFSHCFAGQGDTGKGILMAKEAGAALYETPWVLGCGIALNIPHSFLLSMDQSKIYVNSKGKRFMNEETHYAVVANRVAQQQNPWLILDSNDRNKQEIQIIENGLKTGETVEADSIADLARAMNVPDNNLVKTVENYNSYAQNGNDPLHKEPKYLLALKKAPYYAVKIYPQMIGTIGGVKINLDYQVLNKDNQVIPGLFATGETANGGLYNNVYMSGSSVQFVLTSGRIAGKVAAKECK